MILVLVQFHVGMVLYETKMSATSITPANQFRLVLPILSHIDLFSLFLLLQIKS